MIGRLPRPVVLLATLLPSISSARAAPPPPTAPPAPPAPPRSMSVKPVAILLISGEEIGVPLSEIYSNARRVIESNTALPVAALDVISLDERAAAIRNCAGDARCFAAKVRATASNVGYLLTISADRLDEGFLLGFRLVDVETEREIGAAGDEIPVGMSMLGAMENQLPNVFPASIWGQIATLHIDSEPRVAEVTVGGRSCVSPCDLTRMPPGKYEVTIRKAGYLPWQGSVVLGARDTASVSTVLKEAESKITSSPFFWGALGVLVAAGGVVSFLALRSTDRHVNICIAPDQRQCQ